MNYTKNKQLLREEALGQRREISSTHKISGDKMIAKYLTEQLIWSERQVVHCYIPIEKDREVETKKCLAWLIDRNHEVWTSYLPNNRAGDGFCKLRRDTRFKIGRYGIPLPQEEVIKSCHPTIVIVPCVAVDRQGNRLGYGSGWYDQFLLEHKEALRIGLIYDQFVHRRIFTDEYDQQLDMIVTEKQVIHCERKI